MVKVEGVTKEEIALEEKTSNLLRITEKVLGRRGKARIILDDIIGNIRIDHHPPGGNLGFPISVRPYNNQVSVESPSYFEEAMNLAEAYEIATGEEFTVRREY